jgi:hypothetical protein
MPVFPLVGSTRILYKIHERNSSLRMTPDVMQEQLNEAPV